MATSQLQKSHKVLPLKEGFLEKRQRGRNVKTDSQLKKLKFQKRFCVLTWEGLTYSKDEVSIIIDLMPIYTESSELCVHAYILVKPSSSYHDTHILGKEKQRFLSS